MNYNLNIKQIGLKRDKLLKEYKNLEGKTYKLSEHAKYIQDIKRLDYLKGQISLYDELIVNYNRE